MELGNSFRSRNVDIQLSSSSLGALNRLDFLGGKLPDTLNLVVKDDNFPVDCEVSDALAGVVLEVLPEASSQARFFRRESHREWHDMIAF
jgi:hypothetical protein